MSAVYTLLWLASMLVPASLLVKRWETVYRNEGSR